MSPTGAERWLSQAQDDLEVGRLLVEAERYEHAAFLLQQSVEKALKAVLVADGTGLVRSHDCFLLAKKAEAPEPIAEAADRVSPYYVRTRYPDAADVGLEREDVAPLVDAVEEVIGWSRKRL